MKYIKTFEAFEETGLFTVDDKTYSLYYDEDKIPFQVQVRLHDKIYEYLSITVPDTDKLGRKEFFMSPKISKNMIKVLIDQGFITETGKDSMAGDKPTKSYKIII